LEVFVLFKGVDVSVKSRVVTVKGTRGTLTKTFRHLAVDIYMPDKKTVKVRFETL
jgi:large subunit ribosomal protein L9e